MPDHKKKERIKEVAKWDPITFWVSVASAIIGTTALIVSVLKLFL